MLFVRRLQCLSRPREIAERFQAEPLPEQGFGRILGCRGRLFELGDCRFEQMQLIEREAQVELRLESLRALRKVSPERLESRFRGLEVSGLEVQLAQTELG